MVGEGDLGRACIFNFKQTFDLLIVERWESSHLPLTSFDLEGAYIYNEYVSI